MDVMNKVQLRAACKEAGIKGYGKMTNQQMREAIAAAAKEDSVVAAPKIVIKGAEGLPPGVHVAQIEHVSDDGVVIAAVKQAEGEPEEPKMETASHIGFNPFGSLVKQVCDPTPSVVKKAASSAGIKIEKNREERNGIRRPSAGGLCRAIWDLLDVEVAAGRVATVRRAKELAAANNMNVTNASIEFYLWRKFNGYGK